MIRELEVSGFTVFPEKVFFSFAPGINVVVGGNDSGKSHLLKLCYSLTKWSAEGGKKSLPDRWAEEHRLRKDLMRVFASRNLSALTAQNRGNGLANVRAVMASPGTPENLGQLRFRFHSNDEEAGLSIEEMPKRFLDIPVAFLTAREVFAIFPSFVQLGAKFPEALDGACWDLCRALERPAREGEMERPLIQVRKILWNILAGKAILRDGRFYLSRPGQKLMEMSLVAEGFKRLGMLDYLIANRTVRGGSVLFWDEPEMNLNAIHLPMLGKVLIGLAQAGVQMVLSTHSLFLLRELTIQLAEMTNETLSRRFFGLNAQHEHARGVSVSSGDSLDDIGPIESLEAEIAQADRYLKLS